MVESKALFKTIAESKWFFHSSIILFLNKTDLLEEKIQYSHLVDHFPDFQGPQYDATAAKQFIEDLFIGQLRHPKADRPSKADEVYPFYTCATGKEMEKYQNCKISSLSSFRHQQYSQCLQVRQRHGSHRKPEVLATLQLRMIQETINVFRVCDERK